MRSAVDEIGWVDAADVWNVGDRSGRADTNARGVNADGVSNVKGETKCQAKNEAGETEIEAKREDEDKINGEDLRSASHWWYWSSVSANLSKSLITVVAQVFRDDLSS